MNRWAIVAAAAVLAAALGVVVMLTTDQEDRVPVVTKSEALAFGGIVLPPGADVLGVRGDKGIDQLYTVAIAVNSADVAALLDESGFTTPLQPGRQVHMPPLAEHDPGTEVASAQDRRGTVTREVLVDRTNPARPVVTWWLFTT